MPENAFAGHAQKPTATEVAAVLGKPSFRLWQDLVADLKRDLKLHGEWNTYSVKAGWSLRLKSKNRNIVYLGPREGCFHASFVLGDKAIAAARAGNISERLLKTINEGKRYPEGTAVRIEVRSAVDINALKALVKIKMENQAR